MYISIPQTSKNSFKRNESTFVHCKTRDLSDFEKWTLDLYFKQGFLYWDKSQGTFSSFADAQSWSYDGPTLITGRNLNLGDSESTFINHRSDYFTEKRTGYIKIETPGTYTFSGQADDTGGLMVNGVTGYITWSGIKDYLTITFDKPGFYPFEYYHGENDGGQIAEVYWTTPTNSSRVSVPYEVLYYNTKEYSGE